jgi:hypothetical protein
MSWVVWFIMSVFMGMVLLNFLIAEATNSYNEIHENLEKYIWKYKATMVNDT